MATGSGRAPAGVVIGSTPLSICALTATVAGAVPPMGKSLGVDPAVFCDPFSTTSIDPTE